MLEQPEQLENYVDEPIEDGFELNPIEEPQSPDFNENLAAYLEESELNTIYEDLIEGIQQDKDSMSDWDDTYANGLKYCGLSTVTASDDAADSNKGKSKLSKVFDSTLMEGCLNFYSKVMSELFNEKKLVDYEIIGQKTPQLEQLGELNQAFIENYLREVDKEYYADSGKMIMNLAPAGNIYRKVDNRDPIDGMIKPRFVHPTNIIINYNETSLLGSQRFTELVDISKKEIILREKMSLFIPDKNILKEDGEWDGDTSKGKDMMYKTDGFSPSQGDKKLSYPYYISYAVMDYEFLKNLEQNKPIYPVPYQVFISIQTEKVVGIYRDWKQPDPLHRRRKRYIQHIYFPGFGMFGIGLTHLLSNPVEAITSITRQLINAGEFANFPGYVVANQVKTDRNYLYLEPGQGAKIETGEGDITKAFSPLPYKEPSMVLNNLNEALIARAQRLASIADIKIAENGAQNAPVGTTMALLEVQNILSSAVMRSLYNSVTEELNLLRDVLKEDFEEGKTFQFSNQGKMFSMRKEWFDERIRLLPACNPALDSSTQRIIRSESVLKIASSYPQLHNMREVLSMLYKAMRVDNVDAILLPDNQPIPLDPVTENMNSLQGKPLKAELWQDHPAHIICHQVFAEQNPDVAPVLMAHVKEHIALNYFIQMQMSMGMQMPTDQRMLSNPDIQNQIALKAAEVAAQQQQAAQQQKPPEPTEVMMAEVEQKREASHLKLEEAKMRTETEAFKAQLKFESEKEKIKAEQEMEQDRIDRDLEIAHIKQPTQKEQ